MKKRTIATIALAIFSMFFGAGNLIFPLEMGLHSGENTIYGIFGLLITGILFLIIGMTAMVLFEGDHRAFFGRIGTSPGLIG